MKIRFLFAALFGTAATLLIAGEEIAGSSPVRNLTLDEAVRLALVQNPDILHAKQEIERTRGVVIEVRAEALPQITAVAVYNQQDKRLLEDFGGASGAGGNAAATASPSPATTGTNAAPGGNSRQATTSQFASSPTSVQNKSWQVTIEARQLIYSGGRVTAAIRAAKFQRDSAYWSLRDVVDTVVATTRRQFYAVLLNRELITVREESVRLLQNQLGDQQQRFDAGTVPRFNVLQAEVQLANARPDLIAARNNYALAQLALAKTLGFGANREHPATPPINAVGSLDVTPQDIDLAVAIDTAHALRPFLKVQRLQILTEVEGVKVELAGYQPQVSVNGGYEWRNSRASTDLAEVVNGWFFGATADWNIFDGFATYGRVKQARAKLEEAKITYDDSVHQVDLEVQTAVDNLRQARETLASQQKAVEQALEALRLATERFHVGAGTQLDVLNAQVQLTTARSTELQARHDYNADLAEFERVTATATRYEETFDDPLTHKRKVTTTVRRP